MCTVVLLHRPGHAWPLMLAANRDERLDRPWDPPAEWWAGRPGVIGGRDRSAGGTWMAMNRPGMVAAILNRPGTLGPAAGKRSRGDLPLMALAHDNARAAGEALSVLNAGEWRGFNMVLADVREAIFVRGVGHGRPVTVALPAGVSMVTAHDPNDMESPRVARHLARFQAATAPEQDDWAAWRSILSDRCGDAGEQINVVPRGGFGTVCSSMVALPAKGDPVWWFAAGPPDRTPFKVVAEWDIG